MCVKHVSDKAQTIADVIPEFMKHVFRKPIDMPTDMNIDALYSDGTDLYGDIYGQQGRFEQGIAGAGEQS